MAFGRRRLTCESSTSQSEGVLYRVPGFSRLGTSFEEGLPRYMQISKDGCIITIGASWETAVLAGNQD